MKQLFKLKAKGMILVYLPLVFQVVFVSILFVQLTQLQDKLLKVTESRELITKAHSVSNDVLNFTTRMFFGQGEQGAQDIDVKATRSEVRRIKRPFDEFVELTKRTPSQARNASQLKLASNDFLRVFEEILDHKSKGPQHYNMVAGSYDAKMESGMMLFLEQISKIIDVEIAKRSKGTFITEFKSSFTQTTVAALAIVFGSAVLGIVFALGILKPIKHIAENSRRMSQRQELLPPLSGSDELAELDKYIHMAAKGIEQAFTKEQLMVEEAVDMICIIAADGRFRRVNPATTALTGWKPEELLLQTVFDLIASEDVAIADEYFNSARQNGARTSCDLRLRLKNGQLRETRWSCIYSPADEEVFAVVRDVTDEKKIELLKQNFLDMITHDLRSPLTSMQGSLTLLSEGVRGEISPAVKTEIDVAMSSVEHLAALVNDLLDFQKLTAGKMTMVKGRHNIDEMIADSIGMLRDLAQAKGVTVQTERTGFSLHCDRSKLMQAMNNLIANAVKFSPDGSTVEIRTMISASSSAAPESSDSKVLEFHILDRGSGIPSHLSEKIFEAFERVPGERKEGTGLGLAICKMIVEAHGGTIGIDSGSAGSDFWFKIPMLTEA